MMNNRSKILLFFSLILITVISCGSDTSYASTVDTIIAPLIQSNKKVADEFKYSSEQYRKSMPIEIAAGYISDLSSNVIFAREQLQTLEVPVNCEEYSESLMSWLNEIEKYTDNLTSKINKPKVTENDLVQLSKVKFPTENQIIINKKVCGQADMLDIRSRFRKLSDFRRY